MMPNEFKSELDNRDEVKERSETTFIAALRDDNTVHYISIGDF